MSMEAGKLWAKSKRDDESEHPSMLLARHLVDVHEAGGRLLSATAGDQLIALGLDPSGYGERLRRCVLLAAAVHDLGKANDHFQGMICGTRNVQQNPQGLRHEWVTVLMLQYLREWLLPAVGGNETDFAISEWAVGGHHPAYDHASPPKAPPFVGACGPAITLRMGHPAFADALSWLRTTFSLGDTPVLSDVNRDLTGGNNVFDDLAHWAGKASRVWDKVKRSPDARLVAGVKACLIAADVAGSALPKVRSDQPRWNWIDESLADKPEPGDLAAVISWRLGGAAPRTFQQAVAGSTARVTFVKAGCGSGKTLSAYMWAAELERRDGKSRRLYFCYPTTGTATEGFRDYLFDEAERTPRVGADLFHGRSDVDFDIILKAWRDADASDEARRLDSLRAWKTPVVSCTVDTVLGLVQNNRRGLFGWPALVQSAFVFDEIHAFDDRLFGALLRFLRGLPGLPVLLMTASLPKAREQALREVLGTLDPIPGPAELEDRPRYRKTAATDPLPLVTKSIAAGGKVLWVCNTVGRVMETATRAAGCRPVIYHSRFKYEDRVQRHATVIDAFKRAGPALAICSQVAEMSLDLSADLLVTDLAPVPALIQRLGRLNRRAGSGDPTKPVMVVEPGNALPYTEADLAAARAWLARLPEDGISQRHLADAWEQEGDHPPGGVGSAWLDGGPTTAVTELRDASIGITVLMEADRPRVKARPRDLSRLVLPMPPRGGWESWPRERGIPVAPTGTVAYDPMRGAEWRK